MAILASSILFCGGKICLWLNFKTRLIREELLAFIIYEGYDPDE